VPVVKAVRQKVICGKEEVIRVERLTEKKSDFADQVVSNFLKEEMPELYQELLEGGQIVEAEACDNRVGRNCKVP